jgi:predicted metal-dependent phosphotriesterase family hydrolase
MGGGTNGIPTWQDRAVMLKKLVDAGLGDRIFLANDWMVGITIAPTGTMEVLNKRNPLGILFNLRNTVPYLRTIGVTDQQLRRITTANPEVFFSRTG